MLRISDICSTNLAGEGGERTIRGPLLYHQVCVQLAITSSWKICLFLCLGDITSAAAMYDGWMSNICYSPLARLVG